MRYLILAALSAALALACGGGSKQEAELGTGTTPAQQLGHEIGQTYLALLDDTLALLALRLPSEQLRPALSRLRDDYKVRFANLGCVREAMSDAERAEVERETGRYLDQNGPSDLAWLNQASSTYAASGPEIPALLTEINVLIQYAFFDLLQRQKPGETVTCGS